MDDAIEAGFNHVAFISAETSRRRSKRLSVSICSVHDVTVDYAFQDINDIPGDFFTALILNIFAMCSFLSKVYYTLKKRIYRFLCGQLFLSTKKKDLFST